MKCIRCGTESYQNSICYSCMKKWTDMRIKIFNTLRHKYGKLTPENHPIFISETKRLEKIWKKDKNEFLNELNKII